MTRWGAWTEAGSQKKAAEGLRPWPHIPNFPSPPQPVAP